MIKYLQKLLLFAFVFQFIHIQAQEIEQKLAILSKKYNFRYKTLETDTFFSQKYLLEIPQLVDPENPEHGRFKQRVFLSHRGFEKPVVYITEGYSAEYANNPRYINELSTLLNANQICVEHRYFGESVPKPLEWKYLNIKNAASDHHNVAQILKEIYPGKWVSTGISKGGQTTLYYNYFYPDDVVASVAYVAPVNFSITDKRVYSFLKNVADPAGRQKVFDYQYEMLKNKSEYLTAFEKLAKKRHLTYDMGILKAFELTVFEYSFAYWQWGTTPLDSIPEKGSSPAKMVRHLDMVADIAWVSNKGIHRLLPFFYQAMTEIGFYGYDITPFIEFVDFDKNPDFGFTIPEELHVRYNPAPMQEVDCFIRHEADNIVFIYGEYDPWSATAAEINYNSNLLKIVKPGGSHLTRIHNLPEEQQIIVNDSLKTWLAP